MFAYRPAQKPLHIRLLGHPITHLTLLVALIAGVFGYVRYQHQAELAARISDLDSPHSTQIVERNDPAESISQASSAAVTASTGSDEKEKDEVDGEVEAAVSKESAPSSHRPQASLTLTETTTNPPNGNPTTTSEAKPSPAADSGHAPAPGVGEAPPAAGPRSPTSVRILFAEVQRSFLGSVADSRSVASVGENYSMGLINGLDAKLKSALQDASWAQLESPTSQSLVTNKPVVVYSGTRDEATGQNFGLTVQVTRISSASDDPQGLQLQVRVTRVLRDPSANPPIDDMTIPTPESFQVPSGSSLFLAGALPRRSLQEADEQLYRTVNVLKVLTSEAFKAGTTEFVIFIEPR